MSFIWSRAKAIAQKEIYHVIRDPFTIAFSIGLPIFLVIVFGYAIEFNVKNLNLAVHDGDRTESSRNIINTFGKSQYFIIDKQNSPEKALNTLVSGRDRAALIIPGGFQKDLYAGRIAKLQLLLDGSDNSTVTPIMSYIYNIQNMVLKALANFDNNHNITIKTRFLFNAELNSKWFVIPGLIAVIMSILSVLLTALTIAQEWENGSMELLLSTPAEPMEIIVGKLVPYALLCLGSVIFVYILSRTVFNIPFRGSLWVFGLGCILFLITYLSQGLLISVITRSQHVAMQFATLTGLLPAQLLSGFIFPVDSMPTFFQYFTMILPARWFMTISRESYLKGSSFMDLIGPFSALTILCVIMVVWSVKKFKKDLEP